MKRWAFLLAAVLLVGCSGPMAATDPFFGRQTIAPPGTGLALAAPSANSYYSAPGASRSAQASSPTTPRTSASSNSGSAAAARRTGAPASTGTPAAAPGSSGAAGPRYPAAGASGEPVKPVDPSMRSPSGSSSATRPSGLQARGGAAGSAAVPTSTAAFRRPGSPSAASEPRRLPPAEGAIDIMELPRAGSSGQSAAGFRAAGARPVSYNAEAVSGTSAGGKPGRASRISTVPASYAYAPDYAWLKGRLEYSRIDDRWKLRYIPIDGDTDEFGGSVVLLGSPLLEGYQPGEFVTVYGAVGQRQAGTFAPPYQLERIEPQGR